MAAQYCCLQFCFVLLLPLTFISKTIDILICTIRIADQYNDTLLIGTWFKLESYFSLLLTILMSLQYLELEMLYGGVRLKYCVASHVSFECDFKG